MSDLENLIKWWESAICGSGYKYEISREAIEETLIHLRRMMGLKIMQELKSHGLSALCHQSGACTRALNEDGECPEHGAIAATAQFQRIARRAIQKESSADPLHPNTIQVRYDDLSFLRNMALRANLAGVDVSRYNEILQRVMAEQESYLEAALTSSQSDAPKPTDRYCKAPLVCASCAGREVEISTMCHNSSCLAYAQSVTLCQSWISPTPKTGDAG